MKQKMTPTIEQLRPDKRRQYSTVEEMVHDLSDPEYAENFSRMLHERRFITRLIIHRSLKGFSEADIAEKLGCSKRRIVKLEQGNDADMTLAELHGYAKAVDLDFYGVLVEPDSTCMDEEQRHAAAIQELAKQLR